MSTLAQAGRLLDLDIDTRTPCFLWGPPGVGKSDKVRQAAKSRKGWGYIDFRAVLRDTVAMLGIPDIIKLPGADGKDEKLTAWCPPSELPREKRDGKYGILFLDELNAAHQQVQAACFGLVLDRRLGDYHLPDGWTIVAAGNRQADKSAAQRMPRALANRFHHIEVEAHLDTWITDYAYDNDIDERLIAYLRWREGGGGKGGSVFHVMDTGEDERKFPTPRSWTALNRHIKLVDKFDRVTCFEGHVGMGAATEFSAFLDIFENLPDFDEIVKDPRRAPVPEELDVKYALASSLGRNADRSNFAQILTYTQRMGREYDIVVGIDATRRDEALAKTKAYGEFIMRNKDIQIGSFRI